MPTSLKGWIDSLESEECPESLEREFTHNCRMRIAAEDIHRSKSDNSAVRKFVSDRLRVLWVDKNFWRMIRKSEEPAIIKSHIGEKYDLDLPLFSHNIWLEMVTDEPSRKLLFNILKSKPSVFRGAQVSKEAQNAIDELKSRGAGGLLLEYLGQSEVSRHCLLRNWFKISKETLQQVSTAIDRLKKDITWCLDYSSDPTKQTISTGLYRKRGQPMSAGRDNYIEQLVEIVKKAPMETNDEIANRFNAKYPSPPDIKDLTKILERYRIDAGYAKHLVEVREGLMVKHHVDAENKFGKKPRRKNI